MIKEAFHIATTGRPGPVIIDIPKDVQMRQIVVRDWDPPMNLPGYRPDRRATRHELEQVLEMIRAEPRSRSSTPAAASSPATPPTTSKAFAERTGIPVALTLHGLGGFPSEHFLCLQMLGMHGTVYANYAINEADLLLALGVRFDDRVTGKVSEFAKHGKIVHIDIDPSEINKNKVAHLPIHGDVEPGPRRTWSRCSTTSRTPTWPRGGRYADWIRQIEHWRETEPLRFADRDDAILPQYAIQRLWQILRDRGQLDDTIITTGVGQHQMWAAQYFHFNQPRHWITSGGLGSMGFGLPSAMGAQAAHPAQDRSSTSTATAVS